MINPDASYEVCPRCNGTGQHQTPDNTMVICDYCKGKGVIAFLDGNESIEYVTESVGIKDTKIALMKQFVLFSLVTMVANTFHSLWNGGFSGSNWLSSFFTGLLWGAGIGVALAVIIIMILNYIPILCGSAEFEDDNYVIINESEYKKQTKLLTRSNLIAIIIIAQTTLVACFPVVIMVSLLEAVIFNIKFFNKKEANIIIRVLFGISAIVILVFLLWSVFDGTIHLNLPEFEWDF